MADGKERRINDRDSGIFVLDEGTPYVRRYEGEDSKACSLVFLDGQPFFSNCFASVSLHLFGSGICQVRIIEETSRDIKLGYWMVIGILFCGVYPPIPGSTDMTIVG
jgi:hypothetical protein